MVRITDYFFLVAVLVCVGIMADYEAWHRSRARHILTGRNRQRRPVHSQNHTRNSNDSTTSSTESIHSSTTSSMHSSSGSERSSENRNPFIRQRQNRYTHPRRRGSQSPEILGNDHQANNRSSMVRSENLDDSRPVTTDSNARGQVQASEQDGSPYSQNQQGNSQQREGNGDSPFYNKMSALDYLTRGVNTNIYHQNANARRVRGYGRIMGESMCEAFNKHYVEISIGGKCV